MNPSGQLRRKDFVHQPMALQQSQAFELRRHEDNLEVGLRSRWNIVPAAFIDYLQVLELEAGIQPRCDLRLQ